MQKVPGFGGFFVRARDPAGLASWYERHLGIAPMPAKQDDPVWAQQAGLTVFAPFPENIDYCGETLMAGSDPNGRFARLHEPEGTSVELWEAPQA